MGITEKPSLFAPVQTGHSSLSARPIAAPVQAGPAQAAQPATLQAMPHPSLQPMAMPHAHPPKPTLFRRLQALTGFGNFLIFAYIFLGEVFLPDHLRATTFLGSRLGGIQGQQAEYSAPQQAKAAAMIDTAKAEVEVIKQCKILRRQTSLGVYNQCLNGPNGSHPMCQLQQEMYLDTYQCNAAGEVLSISRNGLQDF